MIVVKFQGGLGNQMFQYAFYRKLCEIYNNVYADDMDLRENGNEHNGYELDKVFGIKCQSISKKEIKMLLNRQHKHKFSWCCIDYYLRIIGKKKIDLYIQGQYDLDIFNHDDRYYDGYWSDQRYWDDISPILVKDFNFFHNDRKLDLQNASLLKELESRNSVGVHIRRGDYLNEDNQRQFGGICTEEYYHKAIDYIKTRLKDPVFHIFSDDSDYASHFFKNDKYTIVDWNKGEDSFIDMYLMSRCKHNIIANSTFSWWASWLNPNPNRIIIVPHRFNNLSGAVRSTNWPKGFIQLD